MKITLKELRRKNDLTLQQIEKVTGIKWQVLNRYENSNVENIPTLDLGKILSIYELSKDDICSPDKSTSLFSFLSSLKEISESVD